MKNLLMLCLFLLPLNAEARRRDPQPPADNKDAVCYGRSGNEVCIDFNGNVIPTLHDHGSIGVSSLAFSSASFTGVVDVETLAIGTANNKATFTATAQNLNLTNPLTIAGASTTVQALTSQSRAGNNYAVLVTSANGTQYFVVFASGSSFLVGPIGINDSSPDATLDVQNLSGQDYVLRVSSANGTTDAAIFASSGAVWFGSTSTYYNYLFTDVQIHPVDGNNGISFGIYHLNNAVGETRLDLGHGANATTVSVWSFGVDSGAELNLYSRSDTKTAGDTESLNNISAFGARTRYASFSTTGTSVRGGFTAEQYYSGNSSTSSLAFSSAPISWIVAASSGLATGTTIQWAFNESAIQLSTMCITINAAGVNTSAATTVYCGTAAGNSQSMVLPAGSTTGGRYCGGAIGGATIAVNSGIAVWVEGTGLPAAANISCGFRTR